MNRLKVKEFLKILNARNVTDKDEWVMCSCLFAKHRHKHGDNSPSAGIKLTLSGESIYHCFSCNTSGELAGCLMELLYLDRQQGYQSNPIAKALQYLENSDEFQYCEAEIEKEANNLFAPYPENWITSYSSVTTNLQAMGYLKGRDVPLQVIKDFDLKFDHARQMVGFPYRDRSGRVAGMRGRSIDPTAKKKHHDYSYNGKNNAGLVWFRESVLAVDKPLIVVEGQFDCARVYQLYRNTTALLTSFASPAKMQRLLAFDSIIWFTDNDSAGRKSVDQAKNFFQKDVDFHVVDYKDWKGKDPDTFPPKVLKYYLKEFVDLDPLLVDTFEGISQTSSTPEEVVLNT